MVRAALYHKQEHPHVTLRADALQCSINDRLGDLLEYFKCKRGGQDLPPLSLGFLGDYYRIAMEDSEDSDSDGEDEDYYTVD